MTDQPVTLYEVRGKAAWITLNRPEARNALSADLIADLYRHLTAANQDTNVRVIVLTGAGKAFCSGADLKRKGLAEITGHSATYDSVLSTIWHGAKPVIAAVNGHAFAGGLGLIGAADIVIAAEEAVFSFSEVRIGLIPAVISVVCLRKIGTHHGMRLLLTGERFDAKEAVRYGLVHRAVPGGDLLDCVQAEIDSVCLGAPNALIECKKLVRLVPTLSVEDGFARTIEWSKQMFLGEEGTEGMAAFREKRQPNWVE